MSEAESSEGIPRHAIVFIDAQNVYRTTEEAHPGVAAVYAQGETALAGDITAEPSGTGVNGPSSVGPARRVTVAPPSGTRVPVVTS